jgi:hypothetical protein
MKYCNPVEITGLAGEHKASVIAWGSRQLAAFLGPRLGRSRGCHVKTYNLKFMVVRINTICKEFFATNMSTMLSSRKAML